MGLNIKIWLDAAKKGYIDEESCPELKSMKASFRNNYLHWAEEEWIKSVNPVCSGCLKKIRLGELYSTHGVGSGEGYTCEKCIIDSGIMSSSEIDNARK